MSRKHLFFACTFAAISMTGSVSMTPISAHANPKPRLEKSLPCQASSKRPDGCYAGYNEEFRTCDAFFNNQAAMPPDRTMGMMTQQNIQNMPPFIRKPLEEALADYKQRSWADPNVNEVADLFIVLVLRQSGNYNVTIRPKFKFEANEVPPLGNIGKDDALFFHTYENTLAYRANVRAWSSAAQGKSENSCAGLVNADRAPYLSPQEAFVWRTFSRIQVSIDNLTQVCREN